MNPSPTTRGRDAWKWLLGMTLALAVVVGVALQVARRRAGERWFRGVAHWNEEFYSGEVLQPGIPAFNVLGLPPDMVPDFYAFTIRTHGTYFSDTSGGNIFQAWRQSRGGSAKCPLVVRQERNFFGSNIEARISGGEPGQVDAVRAILAAVDVELVVEP